MLCCVFLCSVACFDQHASADQAQPRKQKKRNNPQAVVDGLTAAHGLSHVCLHSNYCSHRHNQGEQINHSKIQAIDRLTAARALLHVCLQSNCCSHRHVPTLPVERLLLSLTHGGLMSATRRSCASRARGALSVGRCRAVQMGGGHAWMGQRSSFLEKRFSMVPSSWRMSPSHGRTCSMMSHAPTSKPCHAPFVRHPPIINRVYWWDSVVRTWGLAGGQMAAHLGRP